MPPRSFVDVPYTFEVRRPGPFEDQFKLFVEVKGTLREIVVKVQGTGKMETK